jgi:hypothetical protein
MSKFIFAVVVMCFSAALAFAQNNSGLTGVVTDANGAVVTGATVTLTDTKTGKEQSTTSNDQGAYSFSKVAPGNGYQLTVSAASFQTFVLKDLALGVGITETHNVQLAPGQVTSTVTVTSSGEATLNTTDASIGNVIDERRLTELPIQLRNSPAALIGLQPGAVGNNVGTGNANRVGSVTGSRADQGNITVDGIDANDQATQQFAATVGNAPIDAIQEFRAVTTNPNAAEGRSSGGQVELVTKSGTNGFHGNVREYNRTAATAANSFFNNASRIARPQLTRNQFGGSLGGRIVRDKLFFFSDYEGRRDAQGVSYLRIVPLEHYRNGGLAYLNNTAGCPTNARLNTLPQCITILTPAQVTALDPKFVGANADLLALFKDRFPSANDSTVGDGINTGGFRFNAPSHRTDNTFTNRIDWVPNDKHRVFGRFNIARRHQTDTVNTVAQQFPQDPESGLIIVRDYSWAVGDTWTIKENLVNQAVVGVSRSGLLFPAPFTPSFPNVFGTPSATGGTWNLGLSTPFSDISSQNRFVKTPTLRDDLTWTKGNHTIQFGGSVKPIDSVSGLTNDFNFVTLGLGGLTTSLGGDPSLRPPNLGTGNVRTRNYDNAFTFLLGRIADVSTNFVNDKSGTAQPPGTGKTRDFAYNEWEFYGQDNWRIRPSLTITAGLRWQYYSAPYEKNGFQACNDIDYNALVAIRLNNAASGTASNTSEPFLRYDLCGKANNARGFYEPDLNNFAPRLGFAWNPSYKEGFLGKMLGDRKTVFRAGGNVQYDRIAGAVTFIQDQATYIFDNSASSSFGNANPRLALLNDPRFTGPVDLPVSNTAPAVTHPFTPFVDASGVPFGNVSGANNNYAIAQNFKVPYSIQYSAGFQREMPGNFLLDMSYVGRQGRKLFSQADANQVLNFKDPASGQFLLPAFNAIQQQLIAGTAITPQPWFENQCFAGCTALVASALGSLVEVGDTSDTIQAMFANGLLNSNVGMGSQFSTNAYITNLGSSSYNGMLVSLRKRMSRGLQFDFNYTWSHSIDNQSSVVNTVFGGLVCDIQNNRVCRADSDFDIRHLINANWIYELPFGRGRSYGKNARGVTNALIGGWEVTGIFTARSGLPFNLTTGAFPTSFVLESPAVLNGNASALQNAIHTTSSGQVQFFSNPTSVFDANNQLAGAVRNPVGGQIGNRNVLRGPGFWNVDLSVIKNFGLPWSEKQRIQLRWEMFNAFNHNSFSLPSTNINSTTFGQITASASSPREMQFAIRFEF